MTEEDTIPTPHTATTISAGYRSYSVAEIDFLEHHQDDDAFDTVASAASIPNHHSIHVQLDRAPEEIQHKPAATPKDKKKKSGVRMIKTHRCQPPVVEGKGKPDSDSSNK